MSLPKGRTNNPNGRPKGPNKVTKELREKIKGIIETQTEHVPEALKKLQEDNPAQYLTIYEKLLSYVIPKRRDITSNDEPIKLAPITGVRIEEDGTNPKSSA